MGKYIICCDFSTMKCSRSQFAKKLTSITSDFINQNNYVWELEISDLDFIPFDSDNICKSIYIALSEFIERDSFFMVFKASESFSNEIAQFTSWRSRDVNDL